MRKYIYAVNVLLELPAHGKYAAGGRAALKGEVDSEQPFTEEGLRHAIALGQAQRIGCDPAGIKFLEFAYTALT